MKLARYLANLGYGTRRDVETLIRSGHVTFDDGRIAREGDTFTHDQLRIDGDILDPAPGAVIMLHKPVGYVTSSTDPNRVVYDLLPPRFLRRTPVIAPAGRLDMDTSGLLLFTDDGALNHRITSPRTHLPKTYRVQLAEDITDDVCDVLRGGGLMLRGDDKPLLPATVELIGARDVRITIVEGRYHQVRRMFAAMGAHVTSLHREAIGDVVLGDLAAGEWRVLTHDERESLSAR